MKELYQEKLPKAEIVTKDLDHDDFKEKLDVMHVCIPDSENFGQIVRDVQAQYLPRLTIVHSTVKVGTTKKLVQPVVHSPVRGIHPHLKEGMQTFVMYIGYDFKEAGEEADKVLRSLGITTQMVHDSRHTELGKLRDTTYYGLAIAYHAYTDRLCDSLGLDFKHVANDWDYTYNLGYKQLGKENVIRPVLYPPEDGKIGGHCIIPNAKTLKDQFGDDEILEAVIRHE